MKLEQLKKSTRETIRKIAKASGMTEKRVLSAMLRPSCAGRVTTPLNYGVYSRKRFRARMVTTHRRQETPMTTTTDKKRICIPLAPAVKERLERVADRNGRSTAREAERAIETYVKRNGRAK